MTIRVALVDDDALVRAGLSMILGGAPDIELVGEATDGSGVVELVRDSKPDVVLMDIRMPGVNGIEATAALRAADPETPRIIVLTTFAADENVRQALASGANGFLLKDTPPADIVDAVRKVALGQPTLSPSVTETLIRQVTELPTQVRTDEARRRLARLSDREREVARAVAEGKANADIASELFMSVPTVKAHVSRLLTKLEVTNRVQVAILVHDAEL